MKNNIHAIPWNTMQHAYGSASNIPELLEKIANNDAKSVSKLAESIAHQGWLSPEVSLAVIPFLFELVSITNGSTKAKLIGLLSDLSCVGSHEHFIGQRMQGNIFKELIENNKEVSSIRKSIIDNAFMITDCLLDENANVRAAAAQFIAVTAQAKELLVQQITKEKDKTTKADMLIALGWLMHSGDDQTILEQYLQDTNNTVCFGAAIGLAYSAPLDEKLLSVIYQVLDSDPVKKSIWCSGHHYDAMSSILIARAQESNDFTVVLNAFSHIHAPSQSIIFRNLININFKREMKSMVKPPKLERLSDLQKNILNLVVDYQLGGSSVEYVLKELGISPTPPGVSLYLGIPLPIGILDSKSISIDGHTKSLYETINHYCTAQKSEDVDEDQVKKLAEAIAEQTDITEFMGVAFGLSKPFKKERHLLVLYFLIAGGKTIEQQLSKKIDELLQQGGTQHYYEVNPKKANSFFCTGDSFLLLVYWTALHQINPNHPVPTAVEKHPLQSEPRSLKYAYQFFGLRIYSGYQASIWFKDAYDACKPVWSDLTMYSDLKEYGWDQNLF